MKDKDDDGEIYDLTLTAAQQSAIDNLSTEQIQEIDALLLSNVIVRWRKVAMAVAKTLDLIPFPISAIYCGERVKVMVAAGLIEGIGNLDLMRYSEVRLPSQQ